MEEIESLVIEAQKTDVDLTKRHEAFGELVVRFQDMAYGCAYAVLGDFDLAQDASQEAFISAYRNLGQLRQPRAFPGWLRRIVLTQCNRLTRGKRLPTESIEVTKDLPSEHPGPADLAEDRELKDRVLAAIKKLPEHERMVTTLFYINGYSQNEIAQFLEVPVTTVKKRLQYSRHRLKERMLGMVKEDLQKKRPSKDDRFVHAVQLFSASEEVAAEGHLNVLEPMLIDGVDVNTRDEDGKTLLHQAVGRGHLDVVELLLRNGADANAKDDSGKTPLKWAVERNHKDVADLLRGHGGIE